VEMMVAQHTIEASCDDVHDQTNQGGGEVPQQYIMECGTKCNTTEFGWGIFKECCDICADNEKRIFPAPNGEKRIRFVICQGCEQMNQKTSATPSLWEKLLEALSCYRTQPYKNMDPWPSKDSSGNSIHNLTDSYMTLSPKFGCAPQRIFEWVNLQLQKAAKSFTKVHANAGKTETHVTEVRNGLEVSFTTSTTTEIFWEKITTANNEIEDKARMVDASFHETRKLKQLHYSTSCTAGNTTNAKTMRPMQLKDITCKACQGVPRNLKHCCQDCFDLHNNCSTEIGRCLKDQDERCSENCTAVLPDDCKLPVDIDCKLALHKLPVNCKNFNVEHCRKFSDCNTFKENHCKKVYIQCSGCEGQDADAFRDEKVPYKKAMSASLAGKLTSIGDSDSAGCDVPKQCQDPYLLWLCLGLGVLFCVVVVVWVYRCYFRKVDPVPNDRSFHRVHNGEAVE